METAASWVTVAPMGDIGEPGLIVFLHWLEQNYGEGLGPCKKG